MADVDFDDYGTMVPSGSAGRRTQRLVNLAGAASSVALIVGLAVWGYKIAVRDVSGIPVVRALEGPMRVAPENPGGEVALHQGLAVNDVAEVGTAAPPADQIVLAPRPEELSIDDAPGLAAAVVLAPDTRSDAAALVGAAGVTAAAVSDSVGKVVPPPALGSAIMAPAPLVEDTEVAVADTTSGDPLVEEGVLPPPVVLEPVATQDPAADAPVVGGAVTRSLRPMARPGRAAVSPEAEVIAANAVAVPAPSEVDAASLKIGERLVQLGAFDDEAGARAEWDKLAVQFGDLMVDKAMIVQSAQSGGRAFFRLRAQGFADEDDARRFCAALSAENAACIPVAHR